MWSVWVLLHSDQETVLWYWFLNLCSYFIWGSFCPRHPVFGFVSARPCRIISHLEAGPGTAIMWLNIKEEVGRADTELIIQVIKCTFHNVHNMWQGLLTDVLGCNSKHRTSRIFWSDDCGWTQELKNSGTGIIADPHQRRNLPVSTLSQKISKFSLDEECHELQYIKWFVMAFCILNWIARKIK